MRQPCRWQMQKGWSVEWVAMSKDIRWKEQELYHQRTGVPLLNAQSMQRKEKVGKSKVSVHGLFLSPQNSIRKHYELNTTGIHTAGGNIRLNKKLCKSWATGEKAGTIASRVLRHEPKYFLKLERSLVHIFWKENKKGHRDLHTTQK